MPHPEALVTANYGGTVLYAVNVTCGGPKLEMKICYDPHSHVNFSNGWTMSTENHANDVACIAHTVNGNNGNASNSVTEWCSPGMQALVVDITGEENELKCGTRLGESVCILSWF